ncbi:MAG: hypothetical protein GY811_04960 [Myxococcales bacterium]|nr:hypothetical protein [Myxococcales bacterium]
MVVPAEATNLGIGVVLSWLADECDIPNTVAIGFPDEFHPAVAVDINGFDDFEVASKRSNQGQILKVGAEGLEHSDFTQRERKGIVGL